MRRSSFVVGFILAYLLVFAGFTLHTQLLYGETIEPLQTVEQTPKEQVVIHQIAEAPVQFATLPDSPNPNEVFKLVNDERVVEGQKPLVANEKLGQLALARAKDMAARQYYAHKNPDGKYYYDFFSQYNIKTDYSCENLDIVFVPDAEMFIKEWVGSAKHHACMTNPDTTDAGFAVVKMMLLEYGGKEVPCYLVVGIHSTPLK